MAKPRTLDEIQKDYNQKLHSLGHLNWQLEHLIPEQIEQVKTSLKQIQREATLASKVANQRVNGKEQAAPPLQESQAEQTESAPQQ